jgi:hypothetical protein
MGETLNIEYIVYISCSLSEKVLFTSPWVRLPSRAAILFSLFCSY